MKKQASTLLPALLDLLRQYLVLDMAVYAGHATLLLLTGRTAAGCAIINHE